jgi:hypothetical protein
VFASYEPSSVLPPLDELFKFASIVDRLLRLFALSCFCFASATVASVEAVAATGLKPEELVLSFFIESDMFADGFVKALTTF